MKIFFAWKNKLHAFSQMEQSSSTNAEILKTLQSINRTAAETEAISSATATLVNAQGEQLDGIARNADTIAENLNTSDWLIRGLQGWKGRLANVFAGPEKLHSGRPRPEGVSRPDFSTSENPSRTNPSIPPSFDREVDSQLDSISGALGNIKARSLALNESINRQIRSVEATDASIEKSTERADRQHSVIKNFK